MKSAPAERVTLRAIAERTGVSRMTVSRALRDDPAVSAGVRQRITQLANRLGYQRDPALGRLMETIRIRKRDRLSDAIAYLTAHDRRAGWRAHQSQQLCHEGAARRAAECGYRLEEFWANEPGMTDARLGEIIWARGIQGVIVAPLPAPQPAFQQFDWARFSAVEVGYSLAQPALHRVCCHHVQSVMLLSEKLHAAGYRRLGLAMSREHDARVHHHWRAGHLSAHSLWGKGPGLMFVGAEWNRAAFSRWLRRARPDAIITIGPQVGEWLRELHVDVPGELGLANVDVALDVPGTTGIDQSIPLIGAAAVDLLTSLIHNHERGVPAVPRVTKVQGTFVQGTSTRSQPRATVSSSSAKVGSGFPVSPPTARYVTSAVIK